jgi:hypothetical protein
MGGRKATANQLRMFDAARIDLPLRAPYARGSDTSKEAAESVEPCSGTLRGVVLEQIAKFGTYGMTCDEAEVATGLTHQTCSARVNELMRLGAIVDSGRRRKTRSKRRATVWVAQHVLDREETGRGGQRTGQRTEQGTEATETEGAGRDAV